MKKTIVSLMLCGSLAVPFVSSAEAAPGGCLKYGAAGAVAGHMVHHGVRGFFAGCAAGMYRRHLYNKQQRDLRRGNLPSRTVAPGGPAPAPVKPM